MAPKGNKNSKANKLAKMAIDEIMPKKTIKNIVESSAVSEDEDNIYNEDVDEAQLSDNENVEEKTDNIEVMEEKNIDIENEDLFGDGDNEIDDEDKGLEDVDSEPEADADAEGDAVAGVDSDEGCLYKFAIKNKELDSDDEIEEDEVYDDDSKIYNMVVEPADRITKPVLFLYERVRILGTRARQLSRGAKPMLLGVEHLSPKEIARKELEHKMIPFIIVRTLPNGKKENWYLKELEIVN